MGDAGARADFAAVDRGDAHVLVSMMDATDAWPAVHAARAWVLERAAVRAAGNGALVLDVGCGPGTFGGAAAAAGASVVDVDRSATMLRAVRHRHGGALQVQGDAAELPLRDGVAHLVRAERVLQWMDDPLAGLAELRRVTARNGWMAITDTDWGTLTVRHSDARATDRLSSAALQWVPHARVASSLANTITALGTSDVATRTDTVVITAWDPDDPTQRDGPPGLPLRSITAGGATPEQPALADDLDVLADRARHGEFMASLDLITVLGRRDD